MKNKKQFVSAEKLRKKGYSFLEISRLLEISKSTVHLWLKNIKLSKIAQERIAELGNNGRRKGLATNKARRDLEEQEISNKVKKYFKKYNRSELDAKIACALSYWCEGAKNKGNYAVSFTNADPGMIQYFLSVFRRSFEIDEKKFRGLIHLHEYHNAKKQLRFWSGITGIPVSQFNKPFIKKHTGINKKENYPGCLNIRYFDSKIYKEIMIIIKHLLKIELRA
jgi:predicted transcriptional regulator